MNSLNGVCVFRQNEMEIYEVELFPSFRGSRFYWKNIGKDTLHGPFRTRSEAHFHHEMFVAAAEKKVVAQVHQPVIIVPNEIPRVLSNVIQVDFRLKRRIV